MNPKPIDEAKDADIRGAWAALQRASAEAERIARLTGTRLVIVDSPTARQKQASLAAEIAAAKRNVAG